MVTSGTKEDFYFNSDGFLVFSEHYHLKRGTCCGMGCLHCPYDHINVKDKSKLIKTSEVKNSK
ncbi:MAG: DUF5522 domain-containing protein [bacterium]|nr:DUF5522 domain-containing protein [bacterium]